MKFINCLKEMPKKYEEVLVWVIYKDKTCGFTESWLDDEGWAMGSAKGFTVTHWMRVIAPND